jgi:hypothetical protein
MKIFLISVLFSQLISSSAHTQLTSRPFSSCPHLAGYYDCGANQPYRSVDYGFQGNYISYRFNYFYPGLNNMKVLDQEFIPNGDQYKATSDERLSDKLSASCRAQKLIVDWEPALFYPAEGYDKVALRQIYSRDRNGDLVVVSAGRRPQDKSYTYASPRVCKKVDPRSLRN